MNFKGTIFEDSNGDGKDDKAMEVSGKLVANYPVTLVIPVNENYFLRNREKIQYKKDRAQFVKKFGDVSMLFKYSMRALGGTYNFENNKVTITFMGKAVAYAFDLEYSFNRTEENVEIKYVL